jgi:hypothetical protein
MKRLRCQPDDLHNHEFCPKCGAQLLNVCGRLDAEDPGDGKFSDCVQHLTGFPEGPSATDPPSSDAFPLSVENMI